jgi:hypothetical protein
MDRAAWGAIAAWLATRPPVPYLRASLGLRGDASLEALGKLGGGPPKSMVDNRRDEIGRAAAPWPLFFENGAASGRGDEANGG